MSETRHFFATTAKAMEPLLKEELDAIGASHTEIVRAGVKFDGTLETAYRACLWSRIANRILLPLKNFSAPTPEKLYGGVRQIRWTDHLSAKETLAVDFSATESQITHTRFGALKVKDAIVDQMRSVQGARPSIDPKTPDVQVNVYIQKDEATVSIDLSGDSLHKRGYREEGMFAPLKENLAAAILILAEWPKKLREIDPRGLAFPAFIDPMCGSGTLAIEAAMMATNRAPGLTRKYYGFLGWKGHDPTIWKNLIDEAREKEIRDRKKIPRIVGYDGDFRAIKVALANLELAGMHGKVHFEKRELSLFDAPTSRGILVVNPPYGERLGEVEELRPLYKLLGDLMKQKLKGWEGYVFTGSPELRQMRGAQGCPPDDFI